MNPTVKSFTNELFSDVADAWREFFRPITWLGWKLAHRFHPHHQYHIIKPRTLKPGYCDPDYRILHAIFHEVTEYAENNLMGDGIDGTRWTQEDFDYYEIEGQQWGKEQFYNQVEAEKKIIALRGWWVVVRPAREQVEDALYELMLEATPEGADLCWTRDDKYKDTPELEQYDRHSKYLFELEEQWLEEDRRKLHEVVDLLPHLWY